MTHAERGPDKTSESPSAEQEMLNWGRLLMDGVPFADLIAAQRRDSEQPWFDFWMGRADDYEKQADAALALDRRKTAGQFLFFASMCAQYAQFLWWNVDRQPGQRRKVDLYRRAAPLFTPTAQRFELKFEGSIIPGYERVPTDRLGRGPVAILIGGLESTKEESYLFENLLLERGIATVTFDGPGQGEMWTDVELGPGFHRYTSAVLDH
ncbi:MAG: alpha/beta hydrolase [Actinobacteria bacterium]|nr:alpha/beta hydrolase [Actinomycetota bacterium]